MKKILIVGGGINQIPLILASKKEGYYVIVVDSAGYKCPSYNHVDKFYSISTQDEETILEIARKERIDGIISNSELCMLVVNSIAEKLHLTGNPVNGISALMSKSRFRALQKRIGLFTPKHYEVTSTTEAISIAERLQYPIIVKPCESSGSRGCCKLDQFENNKVQLAFQRGRHYSRNDKVVIEEFVTMPSLRTIEGDVFVFGDNIIWDGMFYTTRASWAPMVPMTYTGPLLIEKAQMESIKAAVTSIFSEAKILFGEFNIEGFFTGTGEFFVIEINVRQGGNFLPLFLKRFTGIDYDRLLVTTCVGDMDYYNTVISSERTGRYVIMNSVYSPKSGVYKGLKCDKTVKDKIINITELLPIGDRVSECVDGTGIVASVMIECDSLKELYDLTPQINECIQVDIKGIS